MDWFGFGAIQNGETFNNRLRTDNHMAELTQKVGNARLVTDCLPFNRYNDALQQHVEQDSQLRDDVA